MATILTPITLWQDFDDSLPANEEIISEKRENGIVFRDVYFYGRNVGSGAGRVKIYGRYVFPENVEKFPVVMILFEVGFSFDERLVLRFVENGYGVLCVDYCGEAPEGYYTVYPKLVDYANFVRAGRRIDFCDDTAKETSWYEWASVARYAVNYLKHREEVQAIGAVGLRTGGEILFKIAPYASLACMISVCAAGWLAYRGIGKFEGEKRSLDEERHRFIAGLDSQSYAPHIKCPVLLVSAINDKKYNYDRTYDTFRQINPGVEKAILFSAHGSGLVGAHALKDIDLFFDKYLRGRSVFLTKPISVELGEDSDGNLSVISSFDPAGEIKEFGIFFTESVTAFKQRDWTRVFGRSEDLNGHIGRVPLSLYKGTGKALVYAFVKYTNDFSVTSKILEVNVPRPYKNACLHSRVIYCEADCLNGFSTMRRLTGAVADCFSMDGGAKLRRCDGFGGIQGLLASPGIISYRVGEQRYKAPEGVCFRLDAYAEVPAQLRIVFYADEEEKQGYSCDIAIDAKGTWKNIFCNASDFKSEAGVPLADFREVISVAFISEQNVLINNVLWI